MARGSIVIVLFGLLLLGSPFTSNLASAEDDDMEIDIEEYDGEGDEPRPVAELHGEDSDDLGPSDIVTLTDSTFKSTLSKYKFALVEFYAPWCGHCRQLFPHYARAATALKAYPEVAIAQVDASKQEGLRDQFNIQGYPTLKWFVDGDSSKAFEYTGGRDDEGIIKWVKKRVAPPSTILKTTEELASMEKENAVLILGYFSAEEGAEYDEFLKAATKVQDSIFVHTTSSEVAAAADLTAPPSIALLKNFVRLGLPREVKTVSDSMTADALKEFIDAEKLPLLMEFSTENADRIFNSGIAKQIIIWSKAADLKPDSITMETFAAVAAKFKGRLVFVTSNNEGEHHAPVTDFFQLKGAKTPSIVGFEMPKTRKWKMVESFTAENLEAFANAVLTDTYPEPKAQPQPPKDPPPGTPEAAEEEGDGDVVVVESSTFDAIVKDANKDVLLEVYAPWCGHCKTLAPIYKKLAKRFNTISSVVVAKMDGTENEHPDINVEGYPSLMLFPAGEDKKPVAYSGERTLLALTKFIKQHATIPYELPKKGKTADGEAGDEAKVKDEL